MIRISVKDSGVTDLVGKAAKTGRDYHIRKQMAWAYLPNKPFPVEVAINLELNQAAFQPGEYVLDGSAAYVTRYGALELDMSKIKPAAALRAAQS